MIDTRFDDVLKTLSALHAKKMSDYGAEGDEYANVRASEDFGIPGWIGCVVRANDKMRRLMKAAKGGKMSNESVEDSLEDLAVYAIIGLILYQEDQETTCDVGDCL